MHKGILRHNIFKKTSKNHTRNIQNMSATDEVFLLTQTYFILSPIFEKKKCIWLEMK